MSILKTMVPALLVAVLLSACSGEVSATEQEEACRQGLAIDGGFGDCPDGYGVFANDVGKCFYRDVDACACLGCTEEQCYVYFSEPGQASCPK